MTSHGKSAVPILPAPPLTSGPGIGEYHDKLLFGLVALGILRLGILPLSSSLWLDETVTYWSAYKGIGAAIARSQFFPDRKSTRLNSSHITISYAVFCLKK